MKYQKWIDENYPTGESALGKCLKATEEMIKVFCHVILVKEWGGTA